MQAVVFVVAFTVVYLFLYFNLRAARGTLDRPQIVLGTGADGQPIAVEGRQIAGLATPVSLVVALSVAFSAAAQWQEWLSFVYAVPFGETDALFGRDVSFYVFELPVYQAVRQQALVIATIALIGCLLYYVLSGSFVVETRGSAASSAKGSSCRAASWWRRGTAWRSGPASASSSRRGGTWRCSAR